MTMQIFISHSFRDIELIGRLKASLNQRGIKAYVAEADPKYGENLPNKIQKAIEGSDALIAFLTKENISVSVHQEIGYAIKAGKRVIAMVEEGVNIEVIGVLLQGKEVLPFTKDKVEESSKKVTDYVKKVFENEKERNDELIKIIGAVLIIILAFFIIYTMLS